MKEAVLVHIGQPKQSLVYDTLDLILREIWVPVLHQLVHILLHEFKNEVEIVVDTDNFFKLDDVMVVKLSKTLDFP